MKFVSDSEQVYPRATLGHRPDTMPFECDENALDSIGLKSENNMMKDYQNGDGWNVKKLDRSMSSNDLTNNNEKDVSDLTEPYSHSCREIKSIEESGFYMETNVMECELPEIIVCYKESIYHVKDICVDEGVRFQDKIMFKSDVDEKGVCAVLPPEMDRNSEQMEEKNEHDKPLPDVMKSSAENASNRDSSPENIPDKGVVDLFDASKDLTLTEEVKDDATVKIANTISTKLSTLGDLLSMQYLVSKNSHFKSSTTIDGIEVEKGSFECSSGKAVSENPALISTGGESNDGTEEAIGASSDFVSAAEESNGGSEEVVLANPALVSAAEEKHNDSKEETSASSDNISTSEGLAKSTIVDKLSYNSKVETGSITFDFGASAPKLEDAPRHSVSSQAHGGGLGESSFSVLGSLPGQITYSGPIAFSGNLSMRSDSSTTSTRSFAFPVLPSEWNSSPVRMAKADRRLLRKQKCWMQGLLCCRF